MDGRLDRIDTTLAAQHVSLDTHIRRSDLLEESVDHLRREVRPMLVREAILAAAAKVVAVAGSAAGLVYAVIRIVGAAS